MKKLSLALVSSLLLLSCGKDSASDEKANERTVAEQHGAVMLAQARNLMATGNTSAARDTILSLRKRYPLALDSRKQAILTMDSIELIDARREGDSLKIEFYQRKLQFDKQK